MNNIGRFQLPEACRATARREFTLTAYSPRVPGTHLINFERMKS